MPALGGLTITHPFHLRQLRALAKGNGGQFTNWPLRKPEIVFPFPHPSSGLQLPTVATRPAAERNPVINPTSTMRIRTIKPEFWESESLGRLSREARLLFIGLFTCCDDSGRTRANSRILASRLFPYDSDALRLIPKWLSELEREKCVRVYVVDGETFLDIPKWLNHQKIDKPTPSKIPEFARIREDSRGFEKNSLGTGNGNREQGMGSGSGIMDQGKGTGGNPLPPPQGGLATATQPSLPIDDTAKTEEAPATEPEPGPGPEPKAPQQPKPTPDPEKPMPRQQAEAIYAAYPRKVAKDEALKAIEKRLKQGLMFDYLLPRVQAFATATASWSEADKQFIPHPATWFNRGSYDDDPREWIRTHPGDTRQFRSTTAEDHAKGF